MASQSRDAPKAVQFVPEFLETYTLSPEAAADRREPSEEEATDTQLRAGRPEVRPLGLMKEFEEFGVNQVPAE